MEATAVKEVIIEDRLESKRFIIFVKIGSSVIR